MYEFTGSHFCVMRESNGRSGTSLLGYRRKYHALARNVSDTSVSRRAGAPHWGHGTRYQDSTRANGEIPVSSGRKSATFGNSTGRSFSGTATGPPHLSQ